MKQMIGIRRFFASQAIRAVSCTLIACFLSIPAYGSDSLRRQSVNSGGVAGASDGNYSLSCSIGQIGTGVFVFPMDSLFAGFWYFLGVPSEPIELTLPDTTISSGAFIDIPVTVRRFQDVLGLQLRVQFDSAALKVDSVTSDHLSGLTLNIEEGEVTIVWDGNITPITLSDGDALMTFHSECVGAVGSVTSLTWDNTFCALFDTLGNMLPISLIDGQVTVGETESCFTFTDSTGGSYSIILDSVVLSSIPLDSGDEIGVFDGELCVGAATFQGVWPIPLTAWEDDPQSPEKDGYTCGNQMSFKVARHPTCELVPVCACPDSWTEGDGRFCTGAFARGYLKEECCHCEIDLALSAGWNFVSVNVDPEDPYLPNMLDSILPCLNIIKDGGGNFWVPDIIPCDPNLGWLCYWNPLEGYKIHLACPDTLSVSGDCIPCDTAMPLSAGWHWIAYLPEIDQCPDVALASILDCLAIVKAGSGLFWIPGIPCPTPGWLNEMSPGQGYAIYLTCPDTLVYNCEAGLAKIAGVQQDVALEPTHFVVDGHTQEFHAIIVKPSSVLSPGDEIGVYTSSGLLVGAGVYTGEALPIAAWADDPLTDEVEGYTPGEAMAVRVWHSEIGEEIEYEVQAQEGAMTFGESPYTRVSLTAGGAALLPELSLSNNYPNPFNPQTTITFNLPSPGEIDISIFNLLGQKVATIASGQYAAGEHRVVWDGKDDNGNSVSSGLYFYRLTTDGKTLTKKMVLLK
jgi:hypothetical protein